MKNKWLWTGFVSGAMVVALGAMGAHALKNVLTPYGHEIYAKAVLYQMFHVVGLLAVGILQQINKSKKTELAGWLFASGTMLFSGSLYLLAVTGFTWLGMVTPFGGICFIGGWIWLAFNYEK